MDSIGEPSKGPSSEMIIDSSHQDQKVIITNRGVIRLMTEEDRARTDDQRFNERMYKNEMGIRVKYPDEIYNKNYRGNPSSIYVTKPKTGDTEPVVRIVDNRTGRVVLNSPITREEYQSLKD